MADMKLHFFPEDAEARVMKAIGSLRNPAVELVFNMQKKGSCERRLNMAVTIEQRTLGTGGRAMHRSGGIWVLDAWQSEADWEPGSLHTASDLRHGQAASGATPRRPRGMEDHGAHRALALRDRGAGVASVRLRGVLREPLERRSGEGAVGSVVTGFNAMLFPSLTYLKI
ncbi:unnamed protein product, partial [Effrenium voratum]